MAKRAKASTIAEDTAPKKSPQERWEHHWPLISDAKDELDEAQKAVSTANGIYRNALKAYGKEGGDTAALVAALKLTKLDPAEVTKHCAGVNWHMRALGVMAGEQLGFGFGEDGKDIAHHVDNDKLREAGVNQNGAGDNPTGDFDKSVLTTEAMIAKARTAGHDAGADGKKRDGNPHADGSPEFLAYDAAWLEGQTRVARRMGGRGKRGAGEAQPTA